MEVQKKKRNHSKRKRGGYLNLKKSLKNKDVIAMIYGMLDCVDWTMVRIAHNPKHIDRLNLDKFLRACIRRNYMPLILWTMSMKPTYEWNAKAFTSGIRYDRLEILKWLHEQKCPWDEKICDKAAKKGQLHILKWAVDDQKYECPKSWCRLAAEKGNADIIQWVHDKGHLDTVYLRQELCGWIATSGNLELLKWAAANGYPVASLVCLRATKAGHLHVLKWAIENGYQFNPMIHPRLQFFATQHGHIDVLQWLNDNNIN